MPVAAGASFATVGGLARTASGRGREAEYTVQEDHNCAALLAMISA
jgi:hypothetical protein